MYIGVKHEISDPKSFYDKGSALTKSLPQGMRAHLFLPNQDMSSAVCLWEADSVEKVRDLLDRGLGQSARNEYYVVDEKKAIGLDRFLAPAGR